MTETKERYYVTTSSSSDSDPKNLYCDIPRGTYLVRGENVLLIGEVDLDKDDDAPPGYEEGDVQAIFAIQREIEVERRKSDKVKGRKVGELWGGEMEGSGEVLF